MAMKTKIFFIVFLFVHLGFAQEKELIAVPEIQQSNDSVIFQEFHDEILIGFSAQAQEHKKKMRILNYRLTKVYPYAKATASNLVILNDNLAKIPKKRDQKRYIKASQKYLEGQFKDKLKKLSRNDGKILLKLIDRQTGSTAFALIKEFKSGWTAFWSNTTAKTFSLDLKSRYDPSNDIEDFYIETQLRYLFYTYQLEYSEGIPAINYNELLLLWREKQPMDEFFPLELRE